MYGDGCLLCVYLFLLIQVTKQNMKLKKKTKEIYCCYLHTNVWETLLLSFVSQYYQEIQSAFYTLFYLCNVGSMNHIILFNQTIQDTKNKSTHVFFIGDHY